MAEIRTEITEIVTGLGMLGYATLDRALTIQPAAVRNVTNSHFQRFEQSYRSGDHADLFRVAWDNGVTFARSTDGLRGRPPHTLEWKGSHRPPAYEQIPADLRVDHVFLISCKYGSRILINSSPSNLFDHRLTVREKAPVDWFEDVAREDDQVVGASDLPAHAVADRAVIPAGARPVIGSERRRAPAMAAFNSSGGRPVLTSTSMPSSSWNILMPSSPRASLIKTFISPPPPCVLTYEPIKHKIEKRRKRQFG